MNHLTREFAFLGVLLTLGLTFMAIGVATLVGIVDTRQMVPRKSDEWPIPLY